MTKEQRRALANLNGWLMVTVVVTILGVTEIKWAFPAVIPCMLVAAYFQNKFIGNE